MCKKRKEKKLNMQGKDNMVLGYFIINIHMQLRRRGGWLQYFQFLQPRENSREKRRKGSKLHFWDFPIHTLRN